LAEWLTGALAAFAVIVPVELPDKTFVATLVLSTRYRPLPVWAGVTAAFGVQCALAAAAGRVLALLPEQPVRIAAALLFLAGAVLLVRGARDADRAEAEQEQEFNRELDERAPASPAVASTGVTDKAGQARTGWRAFGASFLVLFLAEWGDLSQLLTAGLVASGRPAIPVFIGSWLGLAFVAGMGVLLGRVLLRYVSLRIVRYVGAAVCTLLAAVITYQIIVQL
jgi:putative Ca2+/H+ antiporter (TMEM165/GDT1 family)